MNYSDAKIGIVGLGYVGLPLAVEFGKKRSVIGFDINKERIRDLENGIDETHETTKNDAINLSYTSNQRISKNVKSSLLLFLLQ